jgi:ABC-type multidrug transport system permease subunit
VDNFGLFLLMVILTSNTAISMGYFVSALCPTIALAMAITPMVVIPLMIFGGFFLNSESVPLYFIWLEKISFLRYAFENVIVI